MKFVPPKNCRQKSKKIEKKNNLSAEHSATFLHNTNNIYCILTRSESGLYSESRQIALQISDKHEFRRNNKQLRYILIFLTNK